MAAASGLRVGDVDREAVAASLREHFAVGRLTLEEFQHRLGAAFSAKTDRDLADITGDLPHPATWPDGLPATGMTRAGRGRDWRPGGGPGAARGAAEAGEWHAGAGAGRRGSWRSWAAAVGGLVAVVLAVAIVALLLPVALFGMALSRSLFFVLAALLFGRRGLLRRLRGWLAGFRRRWPF